MKTLSKNRANEYKRKRIERIIESFTNAINEINPNKSPMLDDSYCLSGCIQANNMPDNITVPSNFLMI